MYSIVCNCGLRYIGETKRSLKAHLIKHQTATEEDAQNKSANAKHASEEQRQPKWGSIEFLEHARNREHFTDKRDITHHSDGTMLTP